MLVLSVSGAWCSNYGRLPPLMQEIRNIHNEELMGIRREEEMEMSDDDMEDVPDNSKDSDDSGTTR